MTLHIEEALLKRVMRATGASSKTHAVDLALREMDRRAELNRVLSESLDLSPDELREAFDPASTVVPEALPPATGYGRKPRSRR